MHYNQAAIRFIPGGIHANRLKVYLNSTNDGLINLSLMRDKGVIWKEQNGTFSTKETKSQFIRSLQDVYKHVYSNIGYESLISNHYQASENKTSITFTAQTASRMQIGGNETVLETRLLLHRLFGFPYIPGSALKGLALAAFLYDKKLVGKVNNKDIPLNSTKLNQLAKLNKEKFNKDIIKKIRDLFGSPAIPELKLKEQSGKIIFLDGWPEKLDDDLLDLDSWTVHYPKYYKENNDSEYPGDDQSPNPLLQLCIKKGATFRFVLLADRGVDKKLLEEAKKYLQMGLEHLSIGAKPDYGYFEDFQDITP